MSYNRSLDLMAIATAAVKAGLPAKAAKYMKEAASDAGADAAISAIFAANGKKKPAFLKKKKAKAGLTEEQTALRAAFSQIAGPAENDDAEEDDERDEGDAEVKKSEGEATVSSSDDEDDEDDMKVDDESVAALRAALTTTAKDATIEDMTREEEAEGAGEPMPKVTESKVKASTERFARTLRNLAARSK